MQPDREARGTRDPSEAKRLHALKLAEVEERWSNLRSGQRPLSSDDVARHAATIGDHLRRQVEADPYQQLQWDIEIGASLWTARTGELYLHLSSRPHLKSKYEPAVLKLMNLAFVMQIAAFVVLLLTIAIVGFRLLSL